jgi:hypothetical protein
MNVGSWNGEDPYSRSEGAASAWTQPVSNQCFRTFILLESLRDALAATGASQNGEQISPMLFFDLPDDIILTIVRLLEINDIVALRLVSKSLLPSQNQHTRLINIDMSSRTRSFFRANALAVRLSPPLRLPSLSTFGSSPRVSPFA